MQKNIRTILGGGGFYAALALCVMAVGLGGWYLLFGGAAPAEAPTTELEEPAATPAPAVEEPAVEAVSPALVEEPAPAVSMPEEVVDDTPVVAEAPRLVVDPLRGEVLTAFSVDRLVYSPTLEDWRTHDGVDIAAAAGTTVLAASSGMVVSVRDDALMGTTVVIDHDGGYQTTYANLQAKPTVSRGERVSAGQIIGAVGTTAAAESVEGPHLHFAVTKDGDAIDPSAFLDR